MFTVCKVYGHFCFELVNRFVVGEQTVIISIASINQFSLGAQILKRYIERCLMKHANVAAIDKYSGPPSSVVWIELLQAYFWNETLYEQITVTYILTPD